MTHDFTNNGSETFQEVYPLRKIPNSDTLLHHIEKMYENKSHEDRKELEGMFISVFDVINGVAKACNVFERKVDVAIDLTDKLYYGDKNDYMVVETQPKKGTSHCYRFATINVVVAGRRFTLLGLPVGPLDFKDQIVERLINYARKWVKIRRVYVDRGFFSVDVINILKKLRVKYLMPAVKNKKIKPLVEITESPAVLDYTMGTKNHHATFTLVIVEDDYRIKRAFATNIKIEREKADDLFELYGRRWGVETSYRVKDCFKAKTTSKNYIVRLFYFMFSVLLYNIWMLINVLMGKELFGKVLKKPIVTAKLFGTVLYTAHPAVPPPDM